MNTTVMKTNNGKLIAAIAVFAMIACVFAVATPVAAAGGDASTDATFDGTYASDPAVRGEESAIMTDVAQISFLKTETAGQYLEFKGYGDSYNSIIGNKNLDITLVNGSKIKVTGTLANNDGKDAFGYEDYDYGFIINIAAKEKGDYEWGFGTEASGETAADPYYIYYTNAVGDWVEKELTGDTTSQLIYVDSERDSTTYYFSDEKLICTDESGVPAGTASLTVEWDFTFATIVTEVTDTNTINENLKGGEGAEFVIIKDVSNIGTDLKVTEAGIMIESTSGTSGTLNIGSYGEGGYTDTAKVELTNFVGTISIYKGSVIIDQADIQGGSIEITEGAEGFDGRVELRNAEISNSFTITVPAGTTFVIGENVVINGSLTIAGATEENPVKVRLSNNNTLTVDGTLNLGAYVEMTANGAVTGNGAIHLDTDASLTFSSGMINVTGDGEIINNAVSGGTINLTDGTVVDAKSSVLGSATQEIVVSGEVTVVAGGSITVNGLLTIEEGAELILEEGAKLTINSTGKVDLLGTVTVEATAENNDVIFTYEGSAMTVAGTLDLEGQKSAKLNGVMTVTGTINVGDGASADFAEGSTIAAGGNLNVEGTVSGTITNSGTITIDSEYEQTAGFTVNIRDGGVVDLDNVVGTITIDDTGMKFKKEGADTSIENPTVIELSNIAGVTVSDSLYTYNDEDGVRHGEGVMVISGAADVATNEDDTLADTNDAQITINSGVLNIAEGDTLSMTEDAMITIGDGTNGAEFIVAGTLTNTNKDAKENIVAETNAEITVTGLIQSVPEIKGTVNAALYVDETVDPEINNYTTLEKAIAAGATDIDVLGEITVEENVTIPVGTTVTSTGAIVNIDKDVTLTVAADDTGSAKFKNGTVNVDGTMVVQNLRKSNVVENSVISDVSTKDGVSATYTNIYNALAAAEEGDTVTITKGGDGIVELDKNLTIPARVTLEIPDQKEINVNAGVTVTVDGTLSFEDGKYTMDGKDVTANKAAAKTVVNGLLETSSTTDYRTGDSQIVGAYFMIDNLECIAPVAYAASVINDVESDVEIVGAVTAQDVEFDYTADEGFKIVVISGSSLTAGTITLSGIDMKVEPSSRINATVAVADGSFVLKDVTADTSKTFVISDETVYENEVETHVATLTGDVVDAKDADNKALDGKVTTNGTVAVGVSTIRVDFEAAAGSIATVNGTSTTFSDKVVVNGEIVFDATGIAFNGVLVVYGTVSATEDGSATANDQVRVGYDLNEDQFVDGIAVGDVSGLALGNNGVAIVTPGSTFTAVQDEAEDMLSTEYYIEDALWMTAYASGTNASENIPNLKAIIENAYFEAWQNADKTAIIDNSGDHVAGATIGNEDFQQVYAKIDYNIYTVEVIADEGIGTVYLDGKVMTKVSNVFVLYEGGKEIELAAGEHEISFVLKNSFSGDVKMYVNGTETSGYTFTLEGTDDDNTSPVVYTINLVGVEPTAPVTPSGSSDDGMGLTDYLLIILVVLIVIMAIMVAMRLMRS